MTIKTTRFGDISISTESVLSMPDGMLGFEHCKCYVLIEDRPGSQFKWLQAVDDPALAFIVVNPMDFFLDYDIELTEDDADTLRIEDPSDAVLVTTVTVDKKLGQVTTNLVGPVVINSRTLLAKQVVLSGDRYGTKHLIGRKSDAGKPVEAVAAA